MFLLAVLPPLQHACKQKYSEEEEAKGECGTVQSEEEEVKGEGGTVQSEEEEANLIKLIFCL